MKDEYISKKELLEYLYFKLECGYSEEEDAVIKQIAWVVENWRCPTIKTKAV